MDYRSLWKRWFRLPSSQPGRGPARTRPRLEELEPRLVLSPLTGAPDPSSGQPPSPFQAAVTLFFDGTQLIANQVTLQPQNAVLASIAANSPYAGPLAPFFVASGEVAEINFLQSALPVANALAELRGVSAQAAVTLFFDGAQLIANQATSQPQNAVLASIAANSPSAGPLAPVFVAAGAGAEFQFLQSAVVSLAHALAEFPGSPGAI